MKELIFCLYFAYGLHYSMAVIDYNSSSNGNSIIYKKYLEMDKELQKMANQGVKMLLPTLLEAREHLNISTKCVRETFSLINGLRKLKFWALNFVDASAKLPDGVLSGNVFMFGDFDQCLKATVTKKDGSLDFRGQYCFVDYAPILPKLKGPIRMVGNFDEFVNATRNSSDVLRFLAANAEQFLFGKIKFGVCVPSGCSQQDIDQAIKYLGKKVALNTSVESCQVEGGYDPLNTRSIVIIFIFCFCGCIGIVSSSMEYYMNIRNVKTKSTFTRVLLCFSITSNFQKLMNTKTNEATLLCFHGIKVLSLFYIMLSHEHFIYGLIPGSRHLAVAKDYAGRFFAQIPINGFLTVDVFFFLGGFLHSYIRINKEGKIGSQNGKPGFLQIILFRIWRLAPAYIIAVLLAFLMNPRGPFFPKYWKFLEDPCIKNWWRNLLFINNFFRGEDMCFGHSWYVSVDMQLFLLSLFAVGLLIRNPKKGVMLNGAVLVSGIIATAIFCYVVDGLPILLFYGGSEESYNRFVRVYTNPLPHIAPYFTGIFIGYYTATKKEIKIPKVYQAVGWPIAAVCYTSVIFVSMKWNRGADVTNVETALYFAFGRFSFSLGIAWMVFCCVTGHGGIINYILSMKLWIPLSRISYAVYLISPVVQGFNFANRRYLMDIHEMAIVWQYMGDLAISCLLGLVVVVIFESPSIALQTLMLQKKVFESDNNHAKSVEGIENGGFNRFEVTRIELENNKKNVNTSS